MKIEDSDDVESDGKESVYRRQVVKVDTKMALVGAGARILFYSTLLYNVFRNKIQAEFKWWDEVDQFLLLGPVPFAKDVPRLKQLGDWCCNKCDFRAGSGVQVCHHSDICHGLCYLCEFQHGCHVWNCSGSFGECSALSPPGSPLMCTAP